MPSRATRRAAFRSARELIEHLEAQVAAVTVTGFLAPGEDEQSVVLSDRTDAPGVRIPVDQIARAELRHRKGPGEAPLVTLVLAPPSGPQAQMLVDLLQRHQRSRDDPALDATRMAAAATLMGTTPIAAEFLEPRLEPAPCPDGYIARWNGTRWVCIKA
jgi:hypothetical protein